ncbi:MAG: hypothetical protein ACT4PX_10795 [Actinomycetota bacterium]
MFRRQQKDQLDPAAGDVAPEPAGVATGDFTPWDEWEGNWARAEQERVAHWLADRFGLKPRSVLETQVERLTHALEPERFSGPERLTHPVFGLDEAAIEERRHRSDAGVAPPSIDVDLRHPGLAPVGPSRHEVETGIGMLRAERDALEAEARDAALAVEVERAAVEALRQQRREVAEALEAERSALASVQEERQRLVNAFQADQLEAERVRSLQAETRMRLDTEIAALEERRHRLLESMEDATAAADRAIAAELAAYAGVAEAREQAGRLQDEHFAIWQALDDEVAALEQRRRQLQGGEADPA